MKNINISGIIIAQNAEEKIEEALQSLWSIADEIILVDAGSTDNTVKKAKKGEAQIVKASSTTNFASLRNKGLKTAKGEWVFYLDTDERITPELTKEIKKLSFKQNIFAFAIPRKNIILGRWMKHGGWWPDYVKRFFKRSVLRKWQGRLHEEPVFQGGLGYLKNPILHLKENNLFNMIKKTNQWSKIEAELLFKADHPPMAWWRFIRIMFSELWLRLVVKKGFLDGGEGIIYAIYQIWSRFITYAKLWEMQLKANKDN